MQEPQKGGPAGAQLRMWANICRKLWLSLAGQDSGRAAGARFQATLVSILWTVRLPPLSGVSGDRSESRTLGAPGGSKLGGGEGTAVSLSLSTSPSSLLLYLQMNECLKIKHSGSCCYASRAIGL